MTPLSGKWLAFRNREIMLSEAPMTLAEGLGRLGRGKRGPLLAAAVALIAAVPGLIAVPAQDRDESRFAEASAQMLETGDPVMIAFQETPRFKKPVGIYWLQALSVALVSHLEDRQIWAYRLPSVLGAMLAAGACVWGARAFLRPRAALLTGWMLGASFILSTEGAIAATDGVLCGCVTLAMSAAARLYLASRGGVPGGRMTKLLFWLALAGSILVKGPIGPMVVILSLGALCVWDRRGRWLKGIGWGWGLILIALVVGPWAMAITVVTDGAFWSAAVGGDLAPKLAGDQEGHGAPPGYYVLLAPLMIFPASLLLSAGALEGWRRRGEAGVRFALCWLIPAWLVFEITPTKLVHYTLPLYGALAWLMGAALEAAEARPLGPRIRGIGAGLGMVAALVFAALGPLAMARVGDWSGAPWAGLAGALYIASGAAGAVLLWRSRPLPALLASGALALCAHAALLGGVAPALHPLWLSRRAVEALDHAGLSPSQGMVAGPVTIAGYEEPSAVFLLGADTELGDAEDAARAILDGRPAIVEARQQGAFERALGARAADARLVGAVTGRDYSNGHNDTLRIYRPQLPGAP
jgi:4-amino-4-deoxy-L-arabinose transferase-like glycosyltransferase